ncbi:patatin-like phospholipase family protein [Paraburkholderia youngii]|uniref:patatin-like phospholipase family protein n=1 Tax=Paraburkholderia youngii TaxID=2782701 RepID=UPI003D216FE4
MDTPERKRIAVAVQGGGAHGAFSWGALDRLLEVVKPDRLEIVALSGTSAGGFNATLCAYALGMYDETGISGTVTARAWQRQRDHGTLTHPRWH